MTVPDDMSVIGFDNLPYTEIMNPPLTTVHAPRLSWDVQQQKCFSS